MNLRTWIASILTCSMLVVAPANADTVAIDLEYRTDTLSWELFAEVVDTEFGNDGSNGIAALRALIDNIDFGVGGDAVNLASGIGAVDPIDPGGANERPAVVQTTGGALDIIYVQNTGVPGSVVGGVGVGARQLIMDGTFSSLASLPTFGEDDNGFTTDGNFLDVPAPGPFGGALAFDGVALNVIDVTPLSGDYNGNGVVDAADYTVWRDNLNSTTMLEADGSGNGIVDSADYTIWTNNFGNTSAPSASVPEPSSLLISIALGVVASTRVRVTLASRQ